MAWTGRTRGSMDPGSYDDWYKTPRGRWIGKTEFRLLASGLLPSPDETLLDIGCGTGYFTCLFAKKVLETDIDSDPSFLSYARALGGDKETYLPGDARALPFRDRSFDLSMAVTSLCFVPETRLALSEMMRVTRRRFVLELLNRQSLLYREKGSGGGQGDYRGAHWHTGREVSDLLSGLPEGISMKTAIFLPGGTIFSRTVESLLSTSLPWGTFLMVSGHIRRKEGLLESISPDAFK